MVDVLRRGTGSFLTAAALIGVAVIAGWVGDASAVAPIGACCGVDGMCTDVLEAVCENSGGTFIGVGPRCDEVSCHSAAPLLSMGALAATVGLLAIVGMWRFRRSGRRDLDDPDQT